MTHIMKESEPSRERPAVSGKNKYTMGMMSAFKEANTAV